jgi:NAD(P)-dependent dehydrogenase (short-subunit alcohol dehydrogenase family)
VIGVGVDISDQASVDAAFARIDAELPQVVGLVNLAGIPSPHSFFELTSEIWDRVMDVNAKGTLLMTQAAATRMVDGGVGGRIVNTSSITALDGGGTFSKTGYAAAKAAVQGLTRGFARELGQYGITANVILPGPIDTDMNPADGERAGDLVAVLSLPHYGETRDIAGMVAFLAGPEGRYVTGASLAVDGGYAA